MSEGGPAMGTGATRPRPRATRGRASTSVRRSPADSLGVVCVDTVTGVPPAIWRPAPTARSAGEERGPGTAAGASGAAPHEADPVDHDGAATITLEPVDEIAVTTVVDNFFDGTLADTAVAKRADLGSAARSPAPWMVEGSSLDGPVAEHGFSALVTVTRSGRRHQVLFDAGVSPNGAVDNMRRLGIAPTEIEAVVLSHGHFDHTTGLDGLARVLGRPTDLPIVLHPEAFTRRRLAVHGRDPFELPTLSRTAVEGMGFTVIEHRQPSFVLDGALLVTGEVDRTTSFETGLPVHQALRHDHWEPDPLIVDDQAVIAHVRGKGLVVLTGCGHAGIVNIVRHARRLTGVDTVHAVMGGFHLGGPLFAPVIPDVVHELSGLDPSVVVPAHCTGWTATHALATSLPDAFVQNSVGTTFTFAAAA
jgi:7,8-dihydropterin-6-yl-methyl-4-(beta-D-ribofuranosyl)aminobenzene 5'-phosphate synthase